MTPEERGVTSANLISAMKAIGEIAKCLTKGDSDDHWKQELGDFCALAVQPLLDVAGIEYYDACDFGWNRQRVRLLANLISSTIALGEIMERFTKGDSDDHWKQELGDFCALAVQPLLDVAGIEYYDACDFGWNRQRVKLMVLHGEMTEP